MLLVRLLVNCGQLVGRFLGSQKLYADFQLHRKSAPQPLHCSHICTYMHIHISMTNWVPLSAYTSTPNIFLKVKCLRADAKQDDYVFRQEGIL